jgi:Bacterial lectin
MRIERRLLLAAALLSASIAGCPWVLSDDFRVGRDAGPPDTGGSERDAIASGDAVDEMVAAEAAIEDAGAALADADASSSPDALSIPDAPSNAEAAPSCCGTFLGDPIDETTFDHWTPLGSARGFVGFTELTPDTKNQAGGIFWPQTEALTDFEMEFDFSITQRRDAGVPADGLAFVAVSDVAGVCEAGANLCVLGSASGFGVLVRTFANSREPSPPYIALVDTSRSLSDDAGPPIFDGAVAHPEGGVVVLVASTDAAPPAGSWRTVCLKVAAGKASVKLEGQTLFSGIPLVEPPLSRWGFVAGTGSFAERNAVRQVRLNVTSGCGDATPCVDAGLCGN